MNKITRSSLYLIYALLTHSALCISEPVIVDSVGLDFQNYWYTGTFGQQIVVDDSGTVHAVYCKTWVTETDTGYQVMYANVTDGIKIGIPSQEPDVGVQPGVVYADGGHQGTPVYILQGVGSRFFSYGASLHIPGICAVNETKDGIIPLSTLDLPHVYGSGFLRYIIPIEMEVCNKTGIAHCVQTDPGGYEVYYWNFDGTTFSEIYRMNSYSSTDVGVYKGMDIPKKYRRNATKGADLAVSEDGSEVTVATLHPFCNVILRRGTMGGNLWPESFSDGLSNNTIYTVYDTSRSGSGENIPNNDPKPYTEVQVVYDDENRLHVVYDATYMDIYLDTATVGLPWDSWWGTYSSIAGDTNAVYYDGSEHPKPQLRYWNSIDKQDVLLAECTYPGPGTSYKWYHCGVFDSGEAVWGKYMNDGPIANIELLYNINRLEKEPELVCLWEEMQGDIEVLTDAEKVFSGTYYAYYKDIFCSTLWNTGADWGHPVNVTNTPALDEGELSVYRGVIDQKIHLFYSCDGFPGSDRVICYYDQFEDQYIQGWEPVEGAFLVNIRKTDTEPVYLMYDAYPVTASGVTDRVSYPVTFRLEQNYPNPFNNQTEIRFWLSEVSDVWLNIYNIRGQCIKTLIKERQGAGPRRLVWDGTNDAGREVATGMYIYRLNTPDGGQARKMLFRK